MVKTSAPPCVDFYLLDSDDRAHTLQFACRLTEKAYGLGNSILLRADNIVEAETLDTLLWTFKQESFVPHELLIDSTVDPSTSNERVVISAAVEPEVDAKVLINLANAMPSEPTHWSRIAEVINANKRIRQHARERYNQYRIHGMSMRTHHLPSRNDQR